MSQEVVFRLHTQTMGEPGCLCKGNPVTSLDVSPPTLFHWVCAGRCGQVLVAFVNKHGGAACDRDPGLQVKLPEFKYQPCHERACVP